MKIIGLTGGSGAGKSAAARILKKLGFAVIETDRVYHGIIAADSQCSRELAEHFGEGIKNSAGGVDTKKLSDLVLGAGKEEKRAELNRIAHRHIIDEVKKMLSGYEKEGYGAAVVDAPQLFESGFDRECDVTLAITAPEEVRIRRIMERDGIDLTRAKRRVASQLPESYLTERCDYIVNNPGDFDRFERDIEEVAKKILS